MTVTAKGTAARNPALDFTKGVLVLFMVLYHSLNYFMYREDVLRSLRFLQPAFILITGLLLTSVYLAKYEVGGRRLRMRLIVRGLKLVLIFTALNIIINLVLTTNYNGAALGIDVFFRNALAVYVTGSRLSAAFEILLPIGYLLMLSPLLLRMHRAAGWLLHLTTALFLVLCTVLAHVDRANPNLNILVVGLLGMTVGVVPMATIDDAARHYVAVVLANAAYVAVITAFNVIYPVHVLGVCLSLILIYSTGLLAGSRGVVQRHIILLGKYSLLSYIAQIAILQVLVRALRFPSSPPGRFTAALVATTALLVVLIKIVDVVRTRSVAANKLYNAVFA